MSDVPRNTSQAEQPSSSGAGRAAENAISGLGKGIKDTAARIHVSILNKNAKPTLYCTCFTTSSTLLSHTKMTGQGKITYELVIFTFF